MQRDWVSLVQQINETKLLGKRAEIPLSLPQEKRSPNVSL